MSIAFIVIELSAGTRETFGCSFFNEMTHWTSARTNAHLCLREREGLV